MYAIGELTADLAARLRRSDDAELFFDQGCRALRVCASIDEKAEALAVVLWHGSGLVWLNAIPGAEWESRYEFGQRWAEWSIAVSPAVARAALDRLASFKQDWPNVPAYAK